MVIQRRGLNSFNSASAGEIYTDKEGPKDEWKRGEIDLVELNPSD